VIDLLDEWSHDNAPRRRVRIRVQNSIGIPPLDSAPQPDLAWVRRKSYRLRRPQPRDVFLLIEVSDSTLDYDRGEKAGLYAQAGIAEYWVVNIPLRCIEVFRDPHGGTYRTLQSFSVGETVRPLAFPDPEFPVSLLFP
jgi:Uma2 family endonuclease